MSEQSNSNNQETVNGPEESGQQTNDDLQRKLDELQRSVEMYKDQLLRKAAEFENYKRRSEIEYGNVIRNANEYLINSLLPILNDFVRSLKSGQDARDYDAFYKGVELIHGKLNKTLEAQGLVAFESVGKPFNVEFHDALLQVPRNDVPPNVVIEEVERGYKLNDKVIRHAKVIVSALPSSGDEPTDIPNVEHPEGDEKH